MAFSIGPPTVNTNSPPMAMSNHPQAMQSTIAGQFPVQYSTPTTKVGPIAPSHPLPQAQFTGQQVLFTARDWQQSVASVYDPNGLKRRWNYSLDLGTEEVSKRQHS